MPRLNLYIILFTILVYAFTAGVTLRDRLLIGTLHRIENNAFFEPTADELFEGAMSGMADVLSEEHGDGYSMYIPPKKKTDYLNIVNNDFKGFGVSLRSTNEGDIHQLFVNYPQYDSPAFRAGLRSGDQILKIGNVPIAEKSYSETMKLLREQESKTPFSVIPFGQTEPKNFDVQKEHIHSDSVEGDRFDSDKRIFCLETHPKIGYIRITGFSGTTAEEFGKALEQMQRSEVNSFILDLRDNPGGDVWACVQIARMLLTPNTEYNVIATVRSRNGYKRSFTLSEGTQRCALPMVVLINGESASASEILAAALQDYRRATVVGTRSFGKGVIQGILTLPFQAGILQLTDAEYRRPNGKNIHRKSKVEETDDWGIIPDRIVELSEIEEMALLDYRQLCSNTISTQRTAVLEQFRRDIENQASEESEEEPFTFTGSAPYYDIQLDEAVHLLMEPQS